MDFPFHLLSILTMKVPLYIKLQPLLLLLFQFMAISFQPPTIHGCEVSGTSLLLTSLQVLKGYCGLTSSLSTLSTTFLHWWA